MQREPTKGQNILDVLYCNKPSPVKACISIPDIVLSDWDLKETRNHKNKSYQWSKSD